MKKLSFFMSLLLLALPLSANAAIARIQVEHQYIASSGTSYAFSSNNTAGNFIIVSVLSTGGISISYSVSDTQGNSYTPLTLDSVCMAGGGGSCQQTFYAPNIKAGANSIIVTYSNTTDVGFTAVEYSGIKTSSPLDVEATPFMNGGASTNVAQSTIFSPQAGSLIFSSLSSEFNNPGVTTGTNITVFQSDLAHADIEGDNLSATAGSQQTVFNAANSMAFFSVTAEAFLPAPAPGTPTPKFQILKGKFTLAAGKLTIMN